MGHLIWSPAFKHATPPKLHEACLAQSLHAKMFSRVLAARSWRAGGLISSMRCSSTATNYDGDYTGPAMKTAIPGPRSKVKIIMLNCCVYNVSSVICRSYLMT